MNSITEKLSARHDTIYKRAKTGFVSISMRSSLASNPHLLGKRTGVYLLQPDKVFITETRFYSPGFSPQDAAFLESVCTRMVASQDDLESPLLLGEFRGSREQKSKKLFTSQSRTFRWHGRRSSSSIRRALRSCSKPRHFYFKANVQQPWRVKCVLALKRWRRSVRPHYANIVRLLFVLYVLFDAKHFTLHAMTENDTGRTEALSPPYQPSQSPTFVFADYIIGSAGLVSAICFAMMFMEAAAFRVMLLYVIYRHTRLQGGSAHPLQEVAHAASHLTALWFAKLLGKRVRLRMTAHEGVKRYKDHANSFATIKETDVVEAAVRCQAAVLLVDFAMTGSRIGIPGEIFALLIAFIFLIGYSARVFAKITVLLLIFLSMLSPHSAYMGFTFHDLIPQVAGILFIILVGPGMLSVDDIIARSQCLVY